MSVLMAISHRYHYFWRRLIAAFEAWAWNISLSGLRLPFALSLEQPYRIDRMEQAALLLDLRNRIVYINPAARRHFFGKSRSWVGQPERASLAWLEEVFQSNGGRREASETVRVHQADGASTFDVLISPIRNKRRTIVGRLAVIHEIETEQAAAQAYAVAQSATELLAKVSHELRTPLGSIINVTEMLDYGVYGPLSFEQKDAIRLIAECSQTMTRLVNDLLEQAHSQRSAFQLEDANFPLEELVGRLRKDARPKATSKGLWLSFEVSPEMPAVIHGDSLRLYQVIQNLVDNAIKYTHTGKVAVKIYPVSDHYFSVQVIDTGIGIPAELQKVIYDPFRRASDLPDDGETEKSFGLGLSIVRQLVSKMNGDIHLISSPSSGSIFTVKLPLKKAVDPAA